jgi:hypothetical protein
MNLCLPVLGFLLLALSSSAAERVALVIGNNAYSELPEPMQLTSPRNDAQDVAAALKKLGYTLVTDGPVMDASQEMITRSTESFVAQAKNAEAAVFYFSGHGIQVGEDNYLMPSDTPNLTSLEMLKSRAVLLRKSIMVELENAGAKHKVIILDCCRDNPFAAQLESALGQTVKAIKTKSLGSGGGGESLGYGPGFYLAFATSPGATAADGNGQRNSLFTAAMLKVLPISAGKDIDFYFRDVKALLPNDQVSWTEHSITGSFALAPAGMAVTPATDAFYRIDDLFDHTRYEGYNKHSRTLVLKNAQQKLKNAGIYSGTVDGASGPATGTAIRSWQGRQGLPVTGRLDEETLNSLDLSDEKEIVIKPTPRPAPAAAATPRQTGGQGAGGSRAPGLPQSSPLSALDENLHAGRISRAAYEQKRRELMLLGR